MVTISRALCHLTISIGPLPHRCLGTSTEPKETERACEHQNWHAKTDGAFEHRSHSIGAMGHALYVTVRSGSSLWEQPCLNTPSSKMGGGWCNRLNVVQARPHHHAKRTDNKLAKWPNLIKRMIQALRPETFAGVVNPFALFCNLSINL